MSKDQGSNSFANERTNKYAYQNDTMQFDTTFPHYIKKQKRERKLWKYNNQTKCDGIVPAAAATPANIAEAGGAMSKPLILLLQMYTIKVKLYKKNSTTEFEYQTTWNSNKH